MSTLSDEELRRAVQSRDLHRSSDEPYDSFFSAAAPEIPQPVPGRAKRISQEDVFRSADELLLAGHRPTIDRVRMHLGRGSPNTINDHLDVWWQKLGARLRDLPGREFPQLPEAVAQALLRLWNTALEGAHETLHASLEEQRSVLMRREQGLEQQGAQLILERAELESREGTLTQALEFARNQVTAANQRAQTLEGTLREREEALKALMVRLESATAECTQLRNQMDSERAAALSTRAKDQERSASAEARWLHELDRARQEGKELDKRLRELQAILQRVQQERDQLRAEGIELRAQLKTSTAVREQLEARVHAQTIAEVRKAPTRQKRRAPRSPTRSPRQSK
jgi:hypothetical protein